MRREVRKPEKIEVRAVTVQPRPPSKTSRFLANERAVMAICMAILIVLGTMLIWPESTDESVYEGEVWGNFRAEGNITGRQVEEEGHVFIQSHPTLDSEGIHVVVSNVTDVHIRTFGSAMNVDKNDTLLNGTIDIFVEDGFLEGIWWDVDLGCTYSDLNGSYSGSPNYYRPEISVSSVNGTATIVHRPDANFDIYVSGGMCVMDGDVYFGNMNLELMGNETASVNITAQGNLRVGTGFHSYINGTLTIWNFKRYKDLWSDELDSIFFAGEDIEVVYGAGSYSEEELVLPFVPWTIEIIIGPDTRVQTSEDRSTGLVLIYLMILVLLSFFLSFIIASLVRKRFTAPETTASASEEWSEIIE